MNIQNRKTLPKVPRLQTLLTAYRFVQNPIPVINEALQTYGMTYEVYMGGVQKIIMTADPGLIQHILQKNHRNYRKSEIQTKTLAHFLGRGLLTSEGAYWLQQRRLIQPGFHKNRLTNLAQIMTEVIEEFLVNLDEEISSNTIVDIYQKMMELTFKIVAKSLFSTSLQEKELRVLSHNLTVIQEFIIKQIRQPFLNPWFKLSGRLKRNEKLAEESNQVILNYIQERRKTDGDFDDLLQMLLDARYEDTGKGMTDRQLIEESLILFIAGHETTANATAWMWYLLSLHETETEKARREVKTQIGEQNPTFSDLSRLSYLTQIIQESMRLYPPAWITDRVAINEDQFNGIAIPKDTMIAAYIYGIHHAESLWENPEQFIPDRFAKEQKKNIPSNAYLPFGGGPRLCIGNSFAMMEMQLILAKMLQKYKVELVKDQKIEMQPLVTLRPRYGIKMKLLKI